MMRSFISAAAILSFAAFAQPLPPKPIPLPTSGGTTYCDVTYVADGETVDGFDTGYISTFIPALPYADVLDNHKHQLKVLDAASKEQDKGGRYNVELSEFRKCDSAADWTKNLEGSVSIQGMTLGGATRVMDVALQQAKEINDRTKGRAKNKDSVDHDPTHAKKTKRDDLGRKIRN